MPVPNQSSVFYSGEGVYTLLDEIIECDEKLRRVHIAMLVNLVHLVYHLRCLCDCVMVNA